MYFWEENNLPSYTAYTYHCCSLLKRRCEITIRTNFAQQNETALADLRRDVPSPLRPSYFYFSSYYSCSMYIQSEYVRASTTNFRFVFKLVFDKDKNLAVDTGTSFLIYMMNILSRFDARYFEPTFTYKSLFKRYTYRCVEMRSEKLDAFYFRRTYLRAKRRIKI